MAHTFRSIAVLAAVLLIASAAEAKLAANKLAANKLAANKLAANKLSATRLAIAKLTKTSFALNPNGAADLLATEDGREVLAFIVSCALPGEITVTATASDGSEYQFFGELGLAKSWLRGPLGKAGQGWISACLLARVSNANVPIPISLRGANPALATNEEERAGWSLEEGAFYGNLFVHEGEPATLIACRGRDQATGETGGLIERDCTEPDSSDPMHTICGFTYAGDCGEFAPAHACKKLTKKLFYKNCYDRPISAEARKYPQVITVYVTP